jgi:hypothetical protein
VRKWLRLDQAPLVEAEIEGDSGVGEESHHRKERIRFSQNEISDRKKERGMKKGK